MIINIWKKLELSVQPCTNCSALFFYLFQGWLFASTSALPVDLQRKKYHTETVKSLQHKILQQCPGKISLLETSEHRNLF